MVITSIRNVYLHYTQSFYLWNAGVRRNTSIILAINDHIYVTENRTAKQIAEEINVLQDADQIPGDCRKLIQTLRDDTSEFCFRIGKSVCGDANAWCATYKFDKQTALPRKALPSDGIVPFLLKSAPVENQFVDFKLIPTEFYIG